MSVYKTIIEGAILRTHIGMEDYRKHVEGRTIVDRVMSCFKDVLGSKCHRTDSHKTHSSRSFIASTNLASEFSWIEWAILSKKINFVKQTSIQQQCEKLTV